MQLSLQAQDQDVNLGSGDLSLAEVRDLANQSRGGDRTGAGGGLDHHVGGRGVSNTMASKISLISEAEASEFSTKSNCFAIEAVAPWRLLISLARRR